MSDSDFIDPNKAAGEIVKGAMDSESFRGLFGPLCANLGFGLGELGSAISFYGVENLKRICPRWAKLRSGKPIDEEAFKRVLPLLREAAMQSDDEMQERWASLLENTANAEDGVLPSFGQTLSQLAPAEARYLDKVWARVMSRSIWNTGNREGRDELSFFDLADIHNPKLRSPSPAEMKIYRDKMSPEQLAAYDEMTKFELMIHDLERLRLIEKRVEYIPGRARYVEVDGNEFEAGHSEGGMRITYALSQYGVSFIKAVRPKEQSEEPEEEQVEQERVNRWQE